MSWAIPGGEFHVQLDGLSCFFLVPICVLSALSAVYGGEYMAAFRERKSLGPHWFFFNVFVTGMALVVVARQVVLFLVAWEVMSLAAFCLVIFEYEKREVCSAGWIYLIATHVGVAFLLGMFLLLGRAAGSLDFDQFMMAGRLAPTLGAVIFLLGLVGFGTKAGLVPFHIWLPEAHPAAPSHVSALMSGVMIKIGLYGLLRTMMFLGAPAVWWGPVLMAVGFLGAVVGVSLALFQRDIKRALAYSSIENIGLILMAFGVGLWGLTSGHRLVALLGLGGGLLHLWNHSMMKGLMFLGAGGVLHGAGTRDMERLGGLLKRMPRTGALMIIGALALAAVPPLNGFVSEWMIYMALLNGGLEFSGMGRIALPLLAGGVALVGGLALICFVRLTGIVWLGESRSEEARHAHEPSSRMLAPMGILAALCVLAAVFPRLLLSVFSRLVETMFALPGGEFMATLDSAQSPLGMLGMMNAVVWAAIALMALIFWIAVRRGRVAVQPTWGCGYLAPTPRMQYTGQSFSEMMVSRIFWRPWRPKTRVVAPEGVFPSAARMTTAYPDTLSRLLYRPFFEWMADRLTRWHWMQQGKLHVYMVYFVVTLVAGFAWMAIRHWVMHD
jgi:formate hydrogenlyase subunit 3/multisubunit Na+/H+ antiporter MnhD subunit